MRPTRPWNWFRNISAMIVGFFVIFLVVETFLTIFVLPMSNSAKYSSWKASDPAFNTTWFVELETAQDMVENAGQTTDVVEYSPYVIYRHKKFTSTYINIDDNGTRFTDNPCAGPGAKKIFLFGGSTAWGLHARDNQTIASFLSGELCSRGYKVEVTNFGEFGFVNTQEMIRLMLELRKGNVPDVAVFYDGVNEVTAAWQTGLAGVPQNLDNRMFEFNLKSKFNIIRPLLESRTAGVFKRLLPASLRPDRSESELSLLADDVVKYYMFNAGAIKALAGNSGFEAAFFWQPAITTKRPLTGLEKSYAARFLTEDFEFLMENVYGKASSSMAAVPGFHDISGVFNGSNESVFVDNVHITEAGNAIVAAEIADKIAGLL